MHETIKNSANKMPQLAIQSDGDISKSDIGDRVVNPCPYDSVGAKKTDASNYDVESIQDGWDSPQRAQNLVEKYIGEGSVILDIGIGTGQTVKGYADKGASIIGLDNDLEMLSVAQNVTSSAGKMRQADINKPLPINDLEGQVDVVQAVGVIEFVNDFDNFMQQVKTALRPGGVFVFTIEELVEDSHKTEHFPSANVTIHRHSVDEIRSVLSRHGLNVVYEEAFNGYIRDNSPVPYRIFLAKN